MLGFFIGPSSNLLFENQCEDDILIDVRSPSVISDPSSILRDCNKEVWRASEGVSGVDAEIIVDMKCPIELQEVQLINGVGEFLVKNFVVYGSNNSSDLWNMLFEEELDQRSRKVRGMTI